MRWPILVSGVLLALACGDPAGAPEPEADIGADHFTENGLLPPNVCAARPVCDAPLDPGPVRSFNYLISKVTAKTGFPVHRGRDFILRPGAPAWAIAKFAYAPADKDLHDEEVDVYLLRGCKGAWERVGTYKTTWDDQHPIVQGVDDTGGYVYADLSHLPPLEVGRHRLRFVVAGDHTSTDSVIEVLADDARVAVADLDGTLTISETEAWAEVTTGLPPHANPGAAEALQSLVNRGFTLMYLTARPGWLVPRTHEWLALRNFPQGIVRTSLHKLPLVGEYASDFKSQEFAMLKEATGLVPEIGFGNTGTDVATYQAAGIPSESAYFFQFDVPPTYGVKQEDYRTLLPTLEALPARCRY